MGLWKSIKDFGSKLIRKIVRPKIDWKKLPAIKIAPRVGPGGKPVIAPNPNAGQKPNNNSNVMTALGLSGQSSKLA